VRKKIYDELEKVLPDESREKIRRKMQNAEKVYVLFRETPEEMNKTTITGMSYFTRTKMKEILELKKLMQEKKRGIALTEAPLTPPEEASETLSETVKVDDDIQQAVNEMTDEEVLQLTNKE